MFTSIAEQEYYDVIAKEIETAIDIEILEALNPLAAARQMRREMFTLNNPKSSACFLAKRVIEYKRTLKTL